MKTLLLYCYANERDAQWVGPPWKLVDYHAVIASWSTLAGMLELAILHSERFNDQASSYLSRAKDHEGAIAYLRSFYVVEWYLPNGDGLYRTAALTEFARRLEQSTVAKDYQRYFQYTAELPQIAADHFLQQPYGIGASLSLEHPLQPTSLWKCAGCGSEHRHLGPLPSVPANSKCPLCVQVEGSAAATKNSEEEGVRAGEKRKRVVG